MVKSCSLIQRFLGRFLVAISLLCLLMHSAAAQPATSGNPQPGLALPADYVAHVLPPEWRASFPHRSAFGSLCSLGPLACALIDRPFAFNFHLDLFIRPHAPDGSTSVLLPIAISVPLFGRAELGLGTCYAGFWDSSAGAMSSNRPSGLCPFWLAGKLILFPWFSDPHEHPALAVEYLFEYQAGPFSGVNQLGLPGPLSKVSLAYRHPLGSLEIGAAVSALVDHVSRAGTLQFGPHISYRLPIGESFWVFGQALVQAPSWGPLVPAVVEGQVMNLAPPVAGSLTVGIQQRANFGWGVGFALIVTKSDQETRADFMFRLPSIDTGPHIQPLFPAREKKEEQEKVAVAVSQPQPAEHQCPPGTEPAPPQTPAQTASSQPSGTSLPAATELPALNCIPISSPVRIPSPMWGHPCYLAPLDGSPHMRMGTIDSTGGYCEWDGLRLPLGAVISPPERDPPPEFPDAQPPAILPPSTASRIPTGQNPPPNAAAPTHKPSASRFKAASAVTLPSPSPRPAPTPAHPAEAKNQVEQVAEKPPSVTGSALASGFVDRAKDTYKHAREIYREVKAHGVGVVLPSDAEAARWLHDVKEQCLDRLNDCLKDKAREAAEDLNQFRQKPWEEKKYAAGGWAFDAIVNTAAAVALPGGGVAAGTVEHAAEAQAEKAAAEAIARKAAKEAAEAEARRLAEQQARHAAEAEARRIAEQQAKERAEREIKERTAQEAQQALASEAPGPAPPKPPTSGETAATARGRQAHKEWDPGPGYRKEETLSSGRRPDAINYEKREVVELKPNNPRAVRRGQKQVEEYKQELEKTDKRGLQWTGRVETYEP